MIAVLPYVIHPKTAVLGRAGGANLSFSTMARVFKAMNISAYFSMPGIGKVALW